jgi:hypothetical protein
MNMSDQLTSLREQLLREARKNRLINFQNIFQLVNSSNDEDFLKQMLGKIPKVQKWYQELRIAYPSKGWTQITKPIAFVWRMTPKETGESLEDLVEVALQDWGCEVVPQAHIVRYLESAIYDVSIKKHIVKINPPSRPFGIPLVRGGKEVHGKLRSIGGLPSMEGSGRFKNRGIVFTRLPNVRNKPDFMSEKIVLEIKNRDPANPYRTFSKFKEDVLDRFKGVRERKRYLLVQKGVVTDPKQLRELQRKKVVLVNLRQQLRRKNQKKVYKDVFCKLGRVLHAHY